MSLKNNFEKKVLIGITGSIAAFKMAEVVSTLVKKKINVQVVMTEAAMHFIGRETFSALTGKKVYSELFSPFDAGKIVHVDLSKDYDIFLIAPASADIISKIAHGIADDMLTTTVLGFLPENVIIAPAMNTRMYENPIIQQNIEKLKHLGYKFIEPSEGVLACREVGKGRLAPWEEIVKYVEYLLNKKNDFKGKKILITAGPTREPIDPVRFITNYSSGKMGYRLAEIARGRGADVTLVTGPTCLTPPYGVNVVHVERAIEMYNSVMSEIDKADIFISAAAVVDFKPKDYRESKIKKEKEGNMVIEFERNPDILKEVSIQKKPWQIVVGFAAETDSLLQNAKKKIEEKNLNLIVANKIGEKGSGFGGDTNKVTIIEKNGKFYEYPLLTKYEVADVILSHIANLLK